MQTYNSMKEFQDAVYNAAIAKQSINAMCSTQCKKGTVKSKVRSSRDNGSNINMTSCNLSSVSQNYVDNHMKVTKKVRQTIQLSGDTVTVSERKIDQSGAIHSCNVSTDKSFEITGNVSYGAANVTATAAYSQNVTTNDEHSSSTYNDESVVFTFSGTTGTAQIYYNAYTCSDAPTLDVIYTFDTITIKASCTYKGDTGIPFDNGNDRSETRTYNLADLGFNGPVIIKTPVVFNVSCSDEWVSKCMI
jgi:hypothetical protein